MPESDNLNLDCLDRPIEGENTDESVRNVFGHLFWVQRERLTLMVLLRQL